MSPTEFADLFRACRDGREWAIANCATMDDVWAKARPEWLLWIATRRGVLDDRTLRLFAVWSARQVQHLMTNPRSIGAIDVAERHANGQATDEEMAAARAAARDAARAAARAAQAAWLRANAKPDWDRARKMGGCAISMPDKCPTCGADTPAGDWERWPVNPGVNLERELALARARIARLEEAGDRLAAFTPSSSDRFGAWRKAKEAKP